MVPKSAGGALQAPDGAHLCLPVPIRCPSGPFWGTGRDHTALLQQGVGEPARGRDRVRSLEPR